MFEFVVLCLTELRSSCRRLVCWCPLQRLHTDLFPLKGLYFIGALKHKLDFSLLIFSDTLSLLHLVSVHTWSRLHWESDACRCHCWCLLHSEETCSPTRRHPPVRRMDAGSSSKNTHRAVKPSCCIDVHVSFYCCWPHLNLSESI